MNRGEPVPLACPLDAGARGARVDEWRALVASSIVRVESDPTSVRLVLRDRAGQTYRESKTFVIASKSPTVQIRLAKTRYRRGEAVELKVAASQNTRTLVARIEGVAPVSLRWDANAGANTGELTIPEQMIPGTYHLTVTAEDIAHNMGTQGVDLEIVP